MGCCIRHTPLFIFFDSTLLEGGEGRNGAWAMGMGRDREDEMQIGLGHKEKWGGRNEEAIN